MTREQATKILKAFNAWRRNKDDALTLQWLNDQGGTPRAIGEALDVAVEIMEQKHTVAELVEK